MFFSKVQESEVTEVENYSVNTPTDSEAHLPPSNDLKNFFTNVKSVSKLFAGQNAVEEEDDENNTVMDFSSGSTQETESTGMWIVFIPRKGSMLVQFWCKGSLINHLVWWNFYFGSWHFFKFERKYVSWHKHNDLFSKVQELEVTEVEEHSEKTSAVTEAQLPPSNGLRNFFTNIKTVAKLVAEQNAVEVEDDENNTFLEFSSGPTQETKPTGMWIVFITRKGPMLVQFKCKGIKIDHVDMAGR